jgi:methylmalonyl-CoA/ethylmalonyl-CoA epimerase
MKFDHIGLVVPKLARGRDHLSNLLQIGTWTVEFEDPINGVSVQFGADDSGVCYEIIAPLGEDSPVARALKFGDRILNHVAYLVPDLEIAVERLGKDRCYPTGPSNPAIAYGGRRIQFFVSPLRFIIELIEAVDHRHHFLVK